MKRLLLISVLCLPAFLIGRCSNCPGERCQSCWDGDFTKCECKVPCTCKKTNCGCLKMGCCDDNVGGDITRQKRVENAIEIKVAQGELFHIDLPRQSASTGYVWEFKRPVSEKFLKQVGKAEKEGIKPGAPGMTTYIFEALRPGKTVIKMHSVRPWEKGGDATSEKTFKIVISRTRLAK